MKPHRIFQGLLLAITILATAIAVSAQERTAANPQNDPLVGALSRKAAFLQTELNKCLAGGASVSTTSVMVTDSAKGVGFSARKDEPEEETSRQEATSTTYGASGVARRVGGYQPASNERLTCEDYSHSYFMRHPAVATVCGADLTPPETTSPTTPSETVSATATISATTHKPVSTTQPHPSSTLPAGGSPR